MSEPFVGEIRIVGFNFAPPGWAFCNGQTVPIDQNQGLFSLLGTTYGGDGRTTFGLPDLRGRVPIHTGEGHTLGERAGEEAHTLSEAELPAHNHDLMASNNDADTISPTGNVFAKASSFVYEGPSNPTPLHPDSLSGGGSNQAHETMQPFLVLNFVIALRGTFPSRN